MESLSQKKSKRVRVDFTNPYPPFPREVLFDLNSTCNCRCFFCSNRKMPKRGLLDKKLCFRLMREFFDMGTRETALYSTGEPFLRPDLAEFVAEAKRIGYEYIFITSNGTLAGPERARPVLDAGLDSIKFSVNAGTRKSYKGVHGVDLFDKVIENIKWFHRYRRRSGLGYRIYVSMVPTSMTRGEWTLLQRLLLPYADEMDCRSCSNQGANMLENNLTERIEGRNLLGSLKEEQYTDKCPDVFFRCTITPDGYLSACVVDYQNYLIVADLNRVSAKDAWHSERFVDLRKRHASGDLKGLVCHSCLNNCREDAAPLMPEYFRPFAKDRRSP
jgi:MoaA/NifB/PqqE/SkfB family radical SAM enzyme